MTSPPPVTVFISYSHKDESLREELDVHLANLKRQDKIQAWHDRAIEAGAEWDAEIKQQLETARVILLLISPRFMASNDCYDLEMQRAIARHDQGTAKVIPILLKPCDWTESPFSKLQVLPRDATPITRWDDQDEAFLNVVQGIRTAIEALQEPPPKAPKTPKAPKAPSPNRSAGGRPGGIAPTAHRIFISYKREAKPDEALALALYQALSPNHEVFIDQTMAVGTRWVERIEQELQRSDFLITLLSAQSVHSEMVFGEVETAHSLGKAAGKPKILPVRVAYREPFAYPLSAYVDPINWAVWDSDTDTARLIEELEQAIAGGDLSIQTPASKADLLQAAEKTAAPPPSAAQLKPPIALEPAEGTMDPESQLYVTRPSDQVALSTIQRQGVTITIKGPRQMGKSSLLMRTMDAALDGGKQVAFIDFQLFDRNILKNADRFYQNFCGTIAEQLGLTNSVEEFWQRSGGNVQRCTRYMQLHILKPLGEPLLLAMDEVDRMFDADFGTDFFSMLRSWHNNRALPMYRIWKQFDLALVTATEPYHLIADLNQSPFNVGEVIALKDFNAEQVADLNQRHGSPLSSAQERQLMDLLEGHPYLVRRALYLLAKTQITVEELFKTASTDRSPFRDHLSYHLFRIYDKQELVQSLLQIIRTHTCPDERVARLLLAAGLVRRQDERLVPRCQLYADYFQKHLHD